MQGGLRPDQVGREDGLESIRSGYRLLSIVVRRGYLPIYVDYMNIHPLLLKFLTKWQREGYASIGFGGTTEALTPRQFDTIAGILSLLVANVRVWQFHHSARDGSEIQAHKLASGLNAVTVIHPIIYGGSIRNYTLLGAGEMRIGWAAPAVSTDIHDSSSLVIITPHPKAPESQWSHLLVAEHLRPILRIKASL